MGSEAQIEGAPAATFGRYQLFASLGRGGMADVFLSVARGPMGFNKLAVVKRLRQALAEEAAFRNMFLDEARLAARLNHPNVVHTYEVGEQNGVYFIAMEYLEGQPLNKVMKEAVRRRDHLEPVICARIISDALAGLQHAHELRDYDGRPLSIIHRDVSPHNIFVTYEGHTKLVDFGIAKAALSSTETEVGVLKGKVAYMSPEQAMGGPIDCRADIFAMGIVLWEMLGRQRLMTGDSAAVTLHRLMNVPIPLVSSVVPGIDPELDAIVARALEKDPAYRFQSAHEMRDALEAYLTHTGAPARQDEVGARISRLFQKVREEVQHQVQRHMAAIASASTTQEAQALTIESLKNMEGGPNASGALLKLGNSGGSGSGVVSNYPPGDSRVGPQSRQQPAGAKSSSALMLLIAAAFLLTSVGLVALMWFRPRLRAVAPPPSATTIVVASPPVVSVAKVDPAPSDTATTSAVAVAPPPPVHSAGPTVPPRPTSTTHGASTTTAPPKGPATTPAATSTGEGTDPGFLTFDTYPWTKVTEGGRSVGTTPLNHVSFSPGAHVLTLENPEQGIKKTYTVTIKSGETFTRRLGLQ